MGTVQKTYKFVVPVPPFCKSSPVTVMKNGRPLTFIPSKPQEKEMKLVLRKLFTIPIPKPDLLKITIIFYRQANRGDGSNYLKGFEDACNKIVWEDDSQLYDVRFIKRKDSDYPRIEFYIEPYDEADSVREFEAKDILAQQNKPSIAGGTI